MRPVIVLPLFGWQENRDGVAESGLGSRQRDRVSISVGGQRVRVRRAAISMNRTMGRTCWRKSKNRSRMALRFDPPVHCISGDAEARDLVKG